MREGDDSELFPQVEVEEVLTQDEEKEQKGKRSFPLYIFLSGILLGLLIAVAFVIWLDHYQNKREIQKTLDAISTEKLKGISSGTLVLPRKNEATESNRAKNGKVKIVPSASQAPKNTQSPAKQTRVTSQAQKPKPAKLTQKLRLNNATNVKGNAKAKQTTSAIGSNQHFSIRVGSYQNQDGAFRRKQQVLSLGTQAEIIKSGGYFVVVAGPYNSLEACRRWINDFTKNAIETGSCR